jgi:hypothetical protein
VELARENQKHKICSKSAQEFSNNVLTIKIPFKCPQNHTGCKICILFLTTALFTQFSSDKYLVSFA